MKKKKIKTFNELLHVPKLKIPQSNKCNSVQNNINLYPLNDTNLCFRQPKPNLTNINIQKSKKSIFKDSLEENVSESKANILLPDSLNESKNSIIIENTIINTSKNNLSTPTGGEQKEKEENIIKNKDYKDGSNKEEEETKKIDYRYYTNYPIKEYFNNNNSKKKSILEKKKEQKLYWLATYDKMMKKQKIIKILNYYYKQNKYKENDIKEKLIQIKDFDIFFPKNSNSPLIKYNLNSLIFTKLYLLTLDNINILLSYINRIKIGIKSNDMEKIIKKGNFQIISDNNNFIYNMIYFMGTFLNINIYGFSNFSNNKKYNYYIDNVNNSLSIDNINQKMPSSKKIAKLVEILMNNYPKYDADFFICYLLSKIKFKSFLQKSNEIKSYLFSNNTIEIHHKIINSNYLAEVPASAVSFTAASIMTPYSSIENNYFNEKNNSSNFINNINEIKGCKTNIIKPPNYINNIQNFNINKNKDKNSTNNIKVMSSKKDNIKGNDILIKSMNMNYIKIAEIKNISKNNRNNYSNIKENKINNNQTKLSFKRKIINNKNNYIKDNQKRNIKRNFKENSNNNLKANNIILQKNYMNKSQHEKFGVSPKLSISEKNFYFNSHKLSTSKILNNKKKKSIKKHSIYYNQTIAKNFYSNTEIQQKLRDKPKNNLNNKKSTKSNLLLNSFDLNNKLIKNNINIKSTSKNKIKERNSNNRGIYVVDRRIKTDIEDDDDSSLILFKSKKKGNFNEDDDSIEEFMTPQRKKRTKYYY